MTRCGTDFRHQYGIFGRESQTSFTRNATRAGSEEGRLFSQVIKTLNNWKLNKKNWNIVKQGNVWLFWEKTTGFPSSIFDSAYVVCGTARVCKELYGKVTHCKKWYICDWLLWTIKLSKKVLGTPSLTLDSWQNIPFPLVEGRVISAWIGLNGPIRAEDETSYVTFG